MALEPMIEASRELPDHVRSAVDAVEDAELPTSQPSSVMLCGMGGSSFGGTLAAGLLRDEAGVPLQVVRDHEPPAFVDEGTLAVATSYSGNTKETVDAADAAHEAGADLVAITTGGDLAELADDIGAPVIEPPTGYQPRAAVGWLWAANHATLSRVLDLDELEAMRSVADTLDDRIDRLADEGGRADRIAGQLGEGPVGVVGHDVFGTVARRWADEICENAKRLGFHAELPEAAHNQVVGWDGTPGDATLVVVGREDENDLEAARTRFLAERARKAGAQVVEARVEGPRLQAVVEAIALGDLTSLHLARREGTDPEPVDVIDALKARLAEALDQRTPQARGND
jgi:glucose/mannose-6-phosphate isomerase